MVARCSRFHNLLRFWSTSQGSCIFPCRCTDGCNTTTGDCLNGGQCEDGQPSGYRWSGTACQTGNVAFNKTASQSTATQVDTYPVERAVDGRTDPTTSYQHCSIPAHNSATLAGLVSTVRRSVTAVAGQRTVRRLAAILRVAVRHTSRDRLVKSARLDTLESSVKALVTVTRSAVTRGQDAILEDVPLVGQTVRKETTGSTVKKHADVAKSNQIVPLRMEIAPVAVKYAIPHLKSSDIPSVDDVTHSSAVASWSKAGNTPPGVDSHYYYVLRWRVDGETKENTTRVEQPIDNIRIEAHITGLMFNTNYSVSVEPYRQDSGQQEGGFTTGVTTFKTSRIGPHPTVTQSLTQLTTNISANANIVVLWKVITESGCDKVVAVRVWYKRQTSNTWQYVEPDSVN
ncbi:hypothetical protein LSAT2_005439 [Lamellibrachia satsuma]|nr:hypothetical protein LSAT2_005439 [Lamellibrachia satsuma]